MERKIKWGKGRKKHKQGEREKRRENKRETNTEGDRRDHFMRPPSEVKSIYTSC